ncbi:MAG: hypothetical protein ACO35I_09910 [Burkholderiaceae bacterium]
MSNAMAAIAAMLNKSTPKPSYEFHHETSESSVPEAAPEPKAKAKRKARPPKANPKSSIIHVRLRDDLLDNLKAKADQHDLSVSQLVRLVLQQAAANPKLTLKPVDNL